MISEHERGQKRLITSSRAVYQKAGPPDAYAANRLSDETTVRVA